MKLHTVKINQINWLNEEENEAEVLFEANGVQFWAFCHPCSFVVGTHAKVQVDFIEDELIGDAFGNENSERRKEIPPSQDDIGGITATVR